MMILEGVWVLLATYIVLRLLSGARFTKFYLWVVLFLLVFKLYGTGVMLWDVYHPHNHVSERSAIIKEYQKWM